jgi:hypothetical protein
MTDIATSLKKAFGIGPKSQEEVEAAFNRQKRNDAVGWSNECDKNIREIHKCMRQIEDSHGQLVSNRYEMEAAIGRNFRKESKSISKTAICNEVNTRFLDLQTLKQAVKVGNAKGSVKEEAQAVLVSQ